MIKKLLLFVRLLFLPQLSLFSVDDSQKKLSVTAKMFCFALLFCASFANAATYYSGINGAPTDANNRLNWWANPGGTGAHPTNFTNAADIFIVQTGHSMATTAAWAVSGSLQIQTGGTLSVAGFDITISGTTSVTGSLIHSNDLGAKTYVGLVTINSTGLWNNSSNAGVVFRGGITNNGTFTSGSGVQTFNTNNQSLIGTLSIPRVTVTGVSLTNTSASTLTVATALAGNGTLVNSGTLNISAATVGITTLTATAAGNTVNYNGAAQTIKSTSYYNLTFSGSGIKTFGATTVATSNIINVAKGVQLNLSGNNNHTARVLILGGVGPLTSTWGAQGSGAANTTNTFFTTTLYGRIIVSGSGTFDPVIDSNYASYTKGVSGKVNASYVENAIPTVLTAPNGTVFINADFASYGTPAGTAPNFTIGTCNAFNSRTVATDVFLGNTTATIPATNATFGDPCVSIVKRLSVVATYTEPICTGTSPGLITGSTPSGGNGSYTYLWEVSTTNATTGYAAAPGTNNAKDYTPGNLTATSWFRRTVYSGLYASETIVIVQVNTAPVAPTAIANTAFCAGSATTLTVSGGSKGGNGGYAQWYTGSCGGTLVGSGDSITVTPTAPTTYYVRYQNGCTTTACFSKLIEGTVSITAASATTPVCYNVSALQTTPLSYSATTGTPTTYSIAWNSTPANSFVAVPYTTLPAGNISISVPAGTNPGVYTGKLTVRNAGTCVSLENTFTVTVNPQPSAPIVGTITQPTCAVPTGSVILSGLPSAGTWTLTRSPGAVVTTGTGTAITIAGLAANTTYTYTVGNGTCTSVASNNIAINQLPLLATWNAGWTNGPPTSNQPVVFAGNYTSAGDLTFCSCTVNSGVDVVISDGNTLTVTNALNVTSGGTLTFENNSSLMQDSNAVNTGEIIYKRVSSMRLSDYEYWSTPVTPQKLFDVSPFTLADKYMGYNGDNWVITSSNTNMTVGKGYIIRGPQTYSNTVRADFTASFKGIPNNGNLSGETVEKDKFYLIGNPYPSALSANEFLKANSFINGTFYFWTHNTPLNITVRDYSSDDYAVFNLTGGVATEAAPSGDDAPGNNPFIPQGHIAAGQSFFASTNDVGTIAFTNIMREGGANNGQFFKPAKGAKEAAKSRIWLNITNEGGAFKQMLVGYVEGATNGIDNRYDGETFDANPYLDFYSVNNDLNYVIQGRALPFTDTDIVPLGYRSTVEGDFTISIQHAEGDLSNQAVYIEDKTAGKIHNLKDGKYTFSTKIGSFNDRLVLRYTDKTLGTGDFENKENNILVSIKNKAIKVNSAKENIKEVTVYDISGKLLYNKKKVGATELQITNLQSANQVLLVKVTLDNDHTTTKKVIFQ